MYVKQLKSDWHKKIMLSVCALFFLSGALWAQNIQVTGKVTDISGEGVPGVYVLIEGTRSGTTTGTSGEYTISAPSNGRLVFSSIGYKTLTVGIVGRSVLNVFMEEDALLLEDIVVVGYGVQRRESLTAAVATVDTKVLEARPIPDIGRGLQGVTPGLSVVNFSGEIGSDAQIRIRGTYASPQGSANPLILLDNVEIPSIQLVNPDDVESISILKDASSASIYGAKAAFGVILITTKKGATRESVNVNYSYNVGFQNISKKMEMGGLDAFEYVAAHLERFNSTVSGAFVLMTREGYQRAKEWDAQYKGVIKSSDPWVYGRDWYVDANNYKIGLRPYDPYDYLVREWAPTQTHNLSVSGRSGKTDFNLSVGYLDQQGLVKPSTNDSFQRYNGSIRVGTDVNKWLRITGGALYSKRVKHYAYSNLPGNADPWLYLYRWSAFYPMGYDENGNMYRGPDTEFAASNIGVRENNYMSINGGATITPLKNWRIQINYTHSNEEIIQKRPGTRFYGLDVWSSAILVRDESGNQVFVNNNGDVVPAGSPGAVPKYTLPLTYYAGAAGTSMDHVRQQHGNAMRNSLTVNTTYDFSLGAGHKGTLMVGAEQRTYDFTDVWGQTTMLSDYNNPQFDLAYGTQTTSGNHAWDSQVGFFGRVNYGFREKYLVEASLRYDGSSKFPKHLKWRYFPSASAAWRVTEEPWMAFAKPVLSSLKLRGSWGMIGDQSVSNNLYVPTLSGSNTAWLDGTTRFYQFSTPTAVSADITWQNIETLGFGVDARLFKSRLGITFDLFQRDTKDMIVPLEGIPLTFGIGAPQGNYGLLRTSGFELQVDFNHRFKNGLGISVVAGLSDALTTILKYGPNNVIALGHVSTTHARWYEGMKIGEIWGYRAERLYQREDFVYANPNDREPIRIQVTAPNGTTYNAYQLADPNAAYQVQLQSGNFLFGPGDVKFKDINGDGFINAGNLNITRLEDGDIGIIGNTTPRYEYSLRLGGDHKGIDFSIFMQGVGSRQLWGDGALAMPGYAADGAIPQAFASNFWREDRTDAFYARPALLGGSNNTLNYFVSDRYLLNMAYFRIKNITLGYTLPTNLTRKVNVNRLRAYVSLENFFTFDNLGTIPIDPEDIPGLSMWTTGTYNSGRAGVGIPTYKTASFGLQLNF